MVMEVFLKMKKNKVYILMATYNGAKYVEEQIESILNQTYKNWKLLIHDDGSKDQTTEIVKKIQKENDDKIELFDDGISSGGAKENFSHLLNIAMERSREFDYIMFSDQDDIWLNDKIEVTLNKMLRTEENNINKPILVHTDLIVFTHKNTVLAESFVLYNKIDPNRNSLNNLLVHNTVTGCTAMINKKLLEYNNIPDSAIMHDYWLGLIASSFGKITYINKPTIKYRIHDSNDYGVKQFDFKYIAQKGYELFYLQKKNSYLNNIKLQKQQACAFLEEFEGRLSNEKIAILKAICDNEKSNVFIRKYLIMKHSIFRYGLVRNIFLMLFI